MRATFEEKFWSYVDKADGCWEWTRSLTKRGGYGRIRYKGRAQRAHRVSYELTYGSVPDGLHVLHSCDNPKCVRPSHLFLGTDRVNADDKVSKKRQAKGAALGNRHGEHNNAAKLTKQQVLTIRQRYELGETQASLALDYGVSSFCIYEIVHHKSWRE